MLCLRELPSDGLAHLAHLDEVDAVFTIAVTPRLVSDVAAPPRVGPTARPPRVTVEIRVAFTVRRAIRGHKIGPAPQVGPNPPAEVQGVEKRELDGPVVVVLLMFCDSVVDGPFQRGQFLQWTVVNGCYHAVWHGRGHEALHQEGSAGTQSSVRHSLRRGAQYGPKCPRPSVHLPFRQRVRHWATRGVGANVLLAETQRRKSQRLRFPQVSGTPEKRNRRLRSCHFVAATEACGRRVKPALSSRAKREAQAIVWSESRQRERAVRPAFLRLHHRSLSWSFQTAQRVFLPLW